MKLIWKGLRIKSLTVSHKSFPQSHRPCAVIDFHNFNARKQAICAKPY